MLSANATVLRITIFKLRRVGGEASQADRAAQFESKGSMSGQFNATMMVTSAG